MSRGDNHFSRGTVVEATLGDLPALCDSPRATDRHDAQFPVYRVSMKLNSSDDVPKALITHVAKVGSVSRAHAFTSFRLASYEHYFPEMLPSDNPERLSEVQALCVFKADCLRRASLLVYAGDHHFCRGTEIKTTIGDLPNNCDQLQANGLCDSQFPVYLVSMRFMTGDEITNEYSDSDDERFADLVITHTIKTKTLSRAEALIFLLGEGQSPLARPPSVTKETQTDAS